MAPFAWTNKHRNGAGSSFIELPLAIWLLVFGMMLPIICAVTIGIRYMLFLNAARQAVHAAAHTQSFEKDFPPDPSAQSLARDTAIRCCQGFSGVKLNDIETSIVVTPVGGFGAPMVQVHKLSSAADEENFLYQIQVRLSGELSPLMPVSDSVFGLRIPGLTAPYVIETWAKEVSEDTQGLNK